MGSSSPRLDPPHLIVAGLEQAAAEREAGAFRAARRRLMALLPRTPPGDPLRAALHNQLGILGKATAQFAAARYHYLTALPLVRRHPRNPYLELADLYHNLGGLAHAQGHHASGEPLARRAIHLRSRRHGPQAIVTWLDRTAHAALLDGLGRSAESESVYRKALPVFRRHFGPRHYEVAVTLNNLGCACVAQGKFPQALSALRQALAVKQGLFGRRHLEVAITRNNLALALADAGRLADARRMLTSALGDFAPLLGVRHPTTRACRRTLARL